MSEQANYDNKTVDNKANLNHEGVKSHYDNVKEALEMLIKLFPKAFSKDQVRPLKIGIFNDIKARVVDVKDLSITKVRAALRVYTTRPEYLQSIVEGAKRIDLDGNEVDTVTKEHQEYSTDLTEQLKIKAIEKSQKRKEANAKAFKAKDKKGQKPFVKKPFAKKTFSKKPFGQKSFTNSENSVTNSSVKKVAFSVKPFNKNTKDDSVKVDVANVKKASVEDIVEGKSVLVSFNNKLTKGVIKEKGPKGTVLVTLEKGMTLNLPIDRIKLENN